VGSEGSAQGRASRIAVVGISLEEICGVRDHATLLAEALARDGRSCTFHWLVRRERSLRASRAEVRAWLGDLARELAAERPDAVLLHYSVFTYSHKGVPVFVSAVVSLLRRSGIPVVTVMHEFAYPWRYGGWRGAIWAVSQRALLIEVLRASSSVIVTAAFRASWLASRRWLPRRRTLVAPVFSNLPAPSVPRSRDGSPPAIGLFGYSYQGAAASLIADALGDLLGRGLDVRLALLGAPGPTSPAGELWLKLARDRGIERAVAFTGRLDAQALSDALAACEVLLFADATGPTSRKGTLAGSLASGRPVVALDGPLSWQELTAADAVRIAQPTARAISDAIAELLADGDSREALGARGRAFALGEMGVARTAQAAATLLDEAVGGGVRPARALS
jgi:glycosyltransferase involved in cell wall biosynthesis